jgi:RecA-family ATPase
MLGELRDQAANIEAPGSHDLDLKLISAAEVKPEVTEWLIEPYVPRKCLSLLVGDPGDGKTWIGLSLAAGLTRGTIPFVGGSAPPQSVLYLSNEDGPGELRARFDRLGGDAAHMWFESAEHLINLSQAGAIEAAVQKHGAALVVIDTITSHFGAKADFHKASEVAAILGPLAAMGQRTGAAILGLMHLSKSLQGKSLYRVQGSTAFAGAARSVLGVGRDPSDPTKYT